ncbi:MAG: radical SAM/SPASM domain-containing protein [Nitrospirota bacterium]
MDISALQYIQFYPTFECNLSCKFCFNRGILSKEKVSINSFRKIVSIMTDIGIREIDILGGEPTLHPEFDRLIEIIYNSKLPTNISTNGTNIKLLESLAKNFDCALINIGISINSDIESDELSEYIIKYKPVIKSVCRKKRTIPEALKKYLSFPDIKYYLIYMDTLYKDDLKETKPFYTFLRELEEIKNGYGNIEGIYCSGFISDTHENPLLQHVRCPAGTTKLSFMPDGSVYPCYLLFRSEKFKLGNILKDSLSNIWNNPILNYFRGFEKNRCLKKDCELFSLCHGGCPAISFIFYDDLDAPDPRCIKN